MISKGKWAGFYKYDNKRIQQLKGVKHTEFEIEITRAENDFFWGTVVDDQKTGGTPGTGVVSGEVNGTVIKFTKQMPILTLLSRDGSRKIFNKPHAPIFYTGQLSDDGKTASGKWKIKGRFALLGAFLALMKTTTGTWEMNRLE